MNRDAYMKKMEARLDEWKSELEQLEAKARGAKQDVRIQSEKEIETARAKMDEAKSRLDEIKSAGEEKWESLEDDAKDLWSRLNTAMEDAMAAVTR